ILANLLSNAFKFSPPQGRVEIRLQALPDKTVIQVADQGPGLSAEAQQQLFEKKRKTLLHPVPPKGKGSWGQGLYLANRFVQAMGGQLAVESKPGEGATFSVSFPTTS
ncbi:ATP-binding protein, partial [Arthrospira platensis SPKY1]|nr:ATP-binding protein [Arthrospira platensis SPKY1]